MRAGVLTNGRLAHTQVGWCMRALLHGLGKGGASSSGEACCMLQLQHLQAAGAVIRRAACVPFAPSGGMSLLHDSGVIHGDLSGTPLGCASSITHVWC